MFKEKQSKESPIKKKIDFEKVHLPEVVNERWENVVQELLRQRREWKKKTWGS